jgi:hypothetical protein
MGDFQRVFVITLIYTRETPSRRVGELQSNSHPVQHSTPSRTTGTYPDDVLNNPAIIKKSMWYKK